MAILQLLLLVSLVAPIWAQEKAWNETVTAGKKEGRVVVTSGADPVMRNQIIPRFTNKFGIAVEFLAGRSSETVGKIRAERQAGIHSVDVFMVGITQTARILLPEKIPDPLKPMLILPEVVDPSRWKKGKPWFIDPEEKYVLRPFQHVTEMLYINTDYVKPEEMVLAKDLLNPKWRGKIATDDPTAKSGSGTTIADHFYLQAGEEFVKRLYIDQKPVRSRDKRQLTDWLARGTYPICFACSSDDVSRLRKEGFKIREIYELSDVPGRLSSSPWVLTVASQAPHPNAARVFANWIVSKEGLEIYSRGHGAATLRNDVDESFLDPRSIPRPGVNYRDEEWGWMAGVRDEIREQVIKLLKPQS
jgi:iron(III) transport system substrate-binding protein